MSRIIQTFKSLSIINQILILQGLKVYEFENFIRKF